MKVLVYHSPGKKAWEEKPKPVILEPKKPIAYHFKLEQIIQAYDTFEHASKEKALKKLLVC